MNIKNYKSKLVALVVVVVVLVGIVAAIKVSGISFTTSEADQEVSKTYSGTVYRADGDHFGDYEFTAEFTVVNGELTAIYFDSEDWGKEKNVSDYCQIAIEDLLDQLRTQDTMDANSLDNVTTATRSSTAFQEMLAEVLADDELGITSIADEVSIEFNVTEDNVQSTHTGGDHSSSDTTESGSGTSETDSGTTESGSGTTETT